MTLIFSPFPSVIRLFFCYLILINSILAKEKISPSSIIVVYNSEIPESKKLADYYAKKRNIPHSHLIGLKLPKAASISRVQYQKQLEIPLREIFTKNKWWVQDTRLLNPITISSKIKLIVTLYGVPYAAGAAKNTANFFSPRNHSVSIDSELSLLGDQHLPEHKGPFEKAVYNHYFKQNSLFKKHQTQGRMLVGRIDANSYITCKRMIDDAIATEKTGLTGMAYLDSQKTGAKSRLADKWLQKIYHQCWQNHTPCYIDTKPQTIPTNYPLRDTALYFGWYAGHLNGPFLHPDFKFKPGAIAVHLHSFSASNLRSKKLGWAGPLLYRGAVATLGNIYEPYLSGTHHFDIFHDRLRKGYTLIESAYMAMPLLGWQGVVLGDPLYQPFPESSTSNPVDTIYTKIATILQSDKLASKLTEKKLLALAKKDNSGICHETLALLHLYKKEPEKARIGYINSYLSYTTLSDKIRSQLQLLELDKLKPDSEAIQSRFQTLRELTLGQPEAKAFTPPSNKTP